MLAVFLFAWATPATTHNFFDLSQLGQTTITLFGAFLFIYSAYGAALLTGFSETHIGIIDNRHLVLLLIISLLSLAITQLLWIRGAGHLGILLASFHMNAVPFYVMVSLALLMSRPWQWQWQQVAGTG